MTDLTEQWKKGELPEGVYYVLYYKNDTAEVDIYRRVYSLYDDSKVRFTIPQVTEVLAPVPSYEEWEKLNWYAGNGIEENQELKMKNTKLKKLLKECRENIASIDYDSSVLDREQSILLNKINQALEEDN